jgi:hypothetical protein
MAKFSPSPGKVHFALTFGNSWASPSLTRTDQHSAPGLVIHMSGHQRTFYGRAYIPDRVPQGLSTDDIR